MRQRHWARDLVGTPWSPDGEGPAMFSCWGLVRYVWRWRYDVEFPAVRVLPDVSAETLENVAAIKQAARVSGMRPVHGVAPRDADIVLLRSVDKLHCGCVVDIRGRIHVVHSAHDVGVVCQPWADAVAGMTPELWRREP